MNIRDLIKKKRENILRIAQSHGATDIKLFGSVARGDEKEDSDIDILVTMVPGSSLIDIIAIKQDLEDLLGYQIDVVTEASLSPYIREDVLKQAVNL